MNTSATNNIITSYHTQRKTKQKLTKPLKCVRNDAWLGEGYYFWEDYEFAVNWGVDSKNNDYDIYTSELDITYVIDSEYSREGRRFFEGCIEKVLCVLDKSGKEYSLKTIHKLLKKMFWDKLGVKGLIFADIPRSSKYGKAKPLFYKKRVQIVMFSLEDIHDFRLTLD